MMATKSKCKSCRADVYWGHTSSGKSCPFDDPENTVSHFTTCPNATGHSKKQTKPKPVTGHICINNNGYQKFESVWREGMTCFLPKGTKYKAFPKIGSSRINGTTKDENIFSGPDILVNPYLKEFVGGDVLGGIFSSGCFCFVSKGWFLVVNMFDVEIVSGD